MRFKAMKITFFGETLKKRKVGSKLWIVAKTEAVAVSSADEDGRKDDEHYKTRKSFPTNKVEAIKEEKE